MTSTRPAEPVLELADGRLSASLTEARNLALAKVLGELAAGGQQPPVSEGATPAAATALLRRIWRWQPAAVRPAVRDHLLAEVSGQPHSDGHQLGCLLCVPAPERAVRPGGGLVAMPRLAHRVGVSYDRSPRDDRYPFRGIQLCDPVPDTIERVAAAVDLLREIPGDVAARLVSDVDRIVIFDSPNIQGFSSALTPGTIYLNHRLPALQTLEQLVHEHTHLLVYRVLDVVRLTTARSDVLIASPLRRDRRPVLGVLHATVVEARLAVLADQLRRSSGVISPAADRHRRAALAGAATLLADGELTDPGRRLIEALIDEADVR